MLAFLLFAVVLIQNAFAQSEGGATEAWFAIPGRAIDLSINEEGQAYALGQSGRVWRWDKAEQRWRPMAGEFARITAAEGNRPWAVDQEGGVHRYNGLWWEPKSDDVLDVAADAKGNVYIARKDTSLWKWYALRSEWRPIPGQAVRLDIGADQSLWGILPDGSVAVFDGQMWVPFAGRALDLAAGTNGQVAIATPEGDIRLLNQQNQSWDLVGGLNGVVTVSVTPEGGLWAVARSGEIYANRKLKEDVSEEEENKAEGIKAPSISSPSIVASVPKAPSGAAPDIAAPPVNAPPQPPSNPTENNTEDDPGSVDLAAISGTEDILFVNTRRAASLLSIGKDGSVFGLDQVGNVLRWSNNRRDFESFPGTLVRIAVDPEGNPWGVTALGRVFRHDGRDWQQVLNAAASDIAIGGDGTVIIANSSGVLFRFNANRNRFDRIQGSGLLVAVDPEGNPWSVRSDKLVQRCDATPCQPLGQKARSISIGPDGRVWIVSDAERLMRLDEKMGRFIPVPTLGLPVRDVASGPNGFPWVATTDGVALSSRFFERAEDQDQTTIATTSDDTVGTGATDTPVSNQVDGFVFTKNMRFETLNRGDLDIFDTPFLDAGNDGEIYAYNYSGGFTKFEEASKSFKYFPSQLGSLGFQILDFTVESDGALWGYINDPQSVMNGLYREKNGAFQQFSVNGAENAGVTAAPDDTIYAIFSFPGSKNYLYEKASNSNVFRRFSTYSLVHDVGVGPGRDIWIVNKNNEVMQWTGSRFEKRPASGQSAARISVGAEGSVYIVDPADELYKWNGANKSFDRVNNTELKTVAVDDTGKPWIGEIDPVTLKRGR